MPASSCQRLGASTRAARIRRLCSTGSAIVESFSQQSDLEPDRDRAAPAAKARPAVLIGVDRAREVSGGIPKAGVWPESVHPLLAVAAVAQHYRHRARMRGVSGAQPADRVRM